MQARLAGAGVLGAGLAGWDATRDVLLGVTRFADAPPPDPVPSLLPPNERRRSSVPARWALTVAGEALGRSGLAAADVATVFTSCGGDGQITDQICKALALDPPAISPTRFHNSVHNSPAGYWGIFARSRAPSTTLCGYQASFAAGLLEAAAQATVECCPVMLVAYDLPCPEPLHALWPVSRPFAAALLLVPGREGDSGPQLHTQVAHGPAQSEWPAALPGDLADNPAAQALLVLAAAARGEGHAELPYLRELHVAVEIHQ
jgi:hypothetical protein